MDVKAIPDGYENIIPHLVVKDAAKAIEFYKKVFGAKELYRNTVPEDESKIVHSVITIRVPEVIIVDKFPHKIGDVQSNDKIASPLSI